MIFHWFFAISVSHAYHPHFHFSSAFHLLVSISQGDQLKQYQDNVQIVEYNIDSDNPLILEKDGKKYRPNKLVYTFATPEGVRANVEWIKTQTEDYQEFLSVEIININGEKKTIDIDNLKELDEPALSQWLNSSSTNNTKSKR